MNSYQRDFIKFAIQNEVWLRTDQVDPRSLIATTLQLHFHDPGLFNSGKLLLQIAKFYAEALQDSGLSFTLLFGPAYKGIPLVCATSLYLAEHFGQEAPFCFNRKEVKDHGEGGQLVGTALAGDVIVVDDVITAGTAIRESFQLIQRHNANLKGVLVALDRQEKGTNTALSAIQQIEQEYATKVLAIVTLDHIVEYLEETGGFQAQIEQMKKYKMEYGSL